MQNIKDIPIAQIPELVRELGLKPFVAKQIVSWLYQKMAASFDEMTNISKDTRKLLSEKFTLGGLKLIQTLESKDGTKKFAWRLSDGKIIESVLIPSEEYAKASRYAEVKVPRQDWRTRLTLCISTQVGCAMGCSFCRTAGMGFVRNLTQGEILDQIIEATHVIASTAILRQAQDDRLHKGMPRITNVVLMGMGEPLANYDNVLGAITVMISASAFGLSKRHVTLSTSGLVPEIGRLAKDNPGVKLAISLNATTDKVRDRLMPINKKYPLEKLFAALRKYSAQVKTSRITFEYVMVKDVNDSADDAKRLVRLISHIPSKVNLIPLNAVQDGSCRPPANATIQSFANILRNKNIQVNIRSSRGQDILAACGQLASKS